ETGRAPQAVAAFESVQAILRKLVDTNPNVTQFQDFLASELQNAGIAYAKTGDRAKSLEAYTASRKLLEKLVASDPSAVALKRALAGTLNNIGDAELSLGRVSEAREAYTEARSLLEPLIKAQPGSPQHQQGLAFSLSGQGRACLQQGQYPAGAADLRAAITIWNRLTLSTNESLYALAGNHALIAGLAQVPGSGISATEAETEAKRAVNCLRKPLQAGYHTVGELRADPDFRALLRRSDFENMLLDLQFPQDPFARR
ncbi:MAG TPA: tetratricopeptide repeat protein, partial [Isosphaeraceae bacterium]|nr:tetratricopeptide repeat protein [Isosphaeraceae bacterium]